MQPSFHLSSRVPAGAVLLVCFAAAWMSAQNAPLRGVAGEQRVPAATAEPFRNAVVQGNVEPQAQWSVERVTPFERAAKLQANACAEEARAGKPPAPACMAGAAAREVRQGGSVALSHPQSGWAAPRPHLEILGTNFAADAYQNWYPAEPALAVGPSHVLAASEQNVRVFSKSGALLFTQDLRTFFSPVLNLPSGTYSLGQPRTAYDPFLDRFWIMVRSASDSAQTSTVAIAVSRTSDAAGSYSFFTLDLTKNGNTATSYWCDPAELGLDAQAIYLGCSMWEFPTSTGGYVYEKIRALEKTQFVNGTCCHWWDWWGFTDPDGTIPYRVIPARVFGSYDGELFVNAGGEGGAGSNLVVRKITGAGGYLGSSNSLAPVMMAAQSVPVDSFTVAPDARQPGTSTKLPSPSTRLLFASYRSGRLITAHNIGCSSGADACVGFFELGVSSWPSISVINDQATREVGYDYTYPAVDINNAGYKTVVFTRSSSTDYPGVGYFGIPSSSVCTGCTDSGYVSILKAGQNSYANGWGYRSDAQTDPDGTGIWILGAYATANAWGTWAGLTAESSSSAVSLGATPFISSVGSSGSTNLYYLFINGSNFSWNSVVLWNGSPHQTTYNSGTRLGVTLVSSDFATAAVVPVTVYTPGSLLSNVYLASISPVPSISTISPALKAAGSAAFTLTVNGSGFTSSSIVQVNGGNRTTTYVSSSQLTASIAAADVAAATTLSITVFNTPPVGGTSNSATLFVSATNTFPLAQLQYLPHLQYGNSYATKLTITNLTLSPDRVLLFYVNPSDGALLSTTSFTLAAGQTTRIATLESHRYNSTSTVQWVIVNADAKLGINEFFDMASPTRFHVYNSIGFNDSPLLTDFTIPAEFEPMPSGTGAQAGRTVGVALANPWSVTSTVTIKLLDADANVLATRTINIPPDCQTIFDAGQLPEFAAVLPNSNFVGVLTFNATPSVAAIGLIDNYGPFSATPPIPGRAK